MSPPSSSSNSRGAVAGAAAAVAFVVAGCGNAHIQPGRTALTAYITNVNAIEQHLQRPLIEINHTYRAFPATFTPPHEHANLQSAARALTRTLHRLTRLHPPEPADPLQHDLVALTKSEATAAADLVQTAAFLPRYQQLTLTLIHDQQQLRGSLTSHDPTVQANALLRHAATCAAIATRIRTLKPPPELTALQRHRLQSLANEETAARALVDALRQQDPRRLSAATKIFSHTEHTAIILDHTNPFITALHAYRARLKKISQLQLLIGRAQQRLYARQH